MIGVVLWSDPTHFKAVFWCEDQGDLAFFDGYGPYPERFAFFDAGDMVQFDLHTDRKLRKAHNPRLLQESACRTLPDALLNNNAPATGPLRSAQIIPFTPRTPVGEALSRLKEA